MPRVAAYNPGMGNRQELEQFFRSAFPRGEAAQDAYDHALDEIASSAGECSVCHGLLDEDGHCSNCGCGEDL